MPIDLGRSFDLMPSIYCEVGYSKLPDGLQNRLNSQASSTKVCDRNPVWNEQIAVPIYVHHLVKQPGVEEPLVLEDGRLDGFCFLAFYDQNLQVHGRDLRPISYIEFPLSYFEPFKPINLQIKLPLQRVFLENDLNFELEQMNLGPPNGELYQRMRLGMLKHIPDFDPTVFLSLVFQAQRDLVITPSLPQRVTMSGPPLGSGRDFADADENARASLQNESNQFVDPEIKAELGKNKFVGGVATMYEYCKI